MSTQDDRTVEILKSAILLEKRGQAFYSNAAGQSKGEAVKSFFEMMADEEVKHVQILSQKFKEYRENKKFNAEDYKDHPLDSASQILTKKIKAEISAAGFEAAAISAAMHMEEKAISIYSDRAIEAEDPNEKALYDWLAKWEAQHLHFLADIDSELRDSVWNDNNFWPY